MARVARTIDQRRIRRLRQQIQDPAYLDGAVDRLAGQITERLLGVTEQPQELALHRSESASRKDIARLLVDDE